MKNANFLGHMMGFEVNKSSKILIKLSNTEKYIEPDIQKIET